MDPRQPFHVQCNNQAHSVGPQTSKYQVHDAYSTSINSSSYIVETRKFPLFDLRRPRNINSYQVNPIPAENRAWTICYVTAFVFTSIYVRQAVWLKYVMITRSEAHRSAAREIDLVSRLRVVGLGTPSSLAPSLAPPFDRLRRHAVNLITSRKVHKAWRPDTCSRLCAFDMINELTSPRSNHGTKIKKHCVPNSRRHATKHVPPVSECRSLL